MNPRLQRTIVEARYEIRSHAARIGKLTREIAVLTKERAALRVKQNEYQAILRRSVPKPDPVRKVHLTATKYASDAICGQWMSGTARASLRPQDVTCKSCRRLHMTRNI